MRRCEVQGCEKRRITPRLCNDHQIDWTNSMECKEGDRKKDFAGAYSMWLARLAAALPAPWRTV